jgi:hypothetical protein
VVNIKLPFFTEGTGKPFELNITSICDDWPGSTEPLVTGADSQSAVVPPPIWILKSQQLP